MSFVLPLDSFGLAPALFWTPQWTTLKFPGKLWRIVNYCHSKAVTWNLNGKSIRIHRSQFQEEFLKKNLFQTEHFSSFVRQLNLYGFKKVFNPITFSEFGYPGEGEEFVEYNHPMFRKGHPELLQYIQRRTKQTKNDPLVLGIKGDAQFIHQNLRGNKNKMSKSYPVSTKGKVDDLCPLCKSDAVMDTNLPKNLWKNNNISNKTSLSRPPSDQYHGTVPNNFSIKQNVSSLRRMPFAMLSSNSQPDGFVGKNSPADKSKSSSNSGVQLQRNANCDVTTAVQEIRPASLEETGCAGGGQLRTENNRELSTSANVCATPASFGSEREVIYKSLVVEGIYEAIHMSKQLDKNHMMRQKGHFSRQVGPGVQSVQIRKASCVNSYGAMYDTASQMKKNGLTSTENGTVSLLRIKDGYRSEREAEIDDATPTRKRMKYSNLSIKDDNSAIDSTQSNFYRVKRPFIQPNRALHDAVKVIPIKGPISEPTTVRSERMLERTGNTGVTTSHNEPRETTKMPAPFSENNLQPEEKCNPRGEAVHVDFTIGVLSPPSINRLDRLIIGHDPNISKLAANDDVSVHYLPEDNAHVSVDAEDTSLSSISDDNILLIPDYLFIPVSDSLDSLLNADTGSEHEMAVSEQLHTDLCDDKTKTMEADVIREVFGNKVREC